MKASHRRVMGLTLWPAAGGLLIIGVLLTLASIRSIGLSADEIRRDLENLAELEAVRAGLQPYLDSKSVFDALPDGEPADIEARFEAVSGTEGGSTVKRSREVLTEDWTRLVLSVSISDVDLEDVWTLLDAVEGDRPPDPARLEEPPWRLTRCRVQAATVPGRGQVELRFEALSRN